jgi:peroxiredoxin
MTQKIILQRLTPFLFLCLLHSNLKAQPYKSITEVKGLSVGAEVPMFTAQDQFGNNYQLSEALKKGPVILLFYRGQWCPVCNRHLKELQDSLQLIYDKGATVIAISPEQPEYLKKTEKKTQATFTLLYDKDYSIGNAFDVIFEPSSQEIDMYNSRLHAQLDQSQSDRSNRLPVPATFIINQSGKIVWRQFNPDYHIRADVKDIIRNLPMKRKSK